MLCDLREYFRYLKFKKNYPHLNKDEIIKIMNDKAINEKEMPDCFIDEDENNLYRLVYTTFVHKDFSLTMKSDVYSRPLGLSQEEVFSVISYIRDILKVKGIPLIKQVKVLESIMREKYGFTKVINYDGQNLVDLYFYSGDPKYFIKSKMYENYFSWYKENIITDSDIMNIYEHVVSEPTEMRSSLKLMEKL